MKKKDDRGLVTELWRSGKNVGARFVRNGESIEWPEMTEQERHDAVENMIEMGVFFNRFLKDKAVK